MNITLKDVIIHLETRQNCKVILIDQELQIVDLQKNQLAYSNKDLRLLNDLAETYVKRKYLLFHKELFKDREDLVDVITHILRIPIDKNKFLRVKPFKKITKKKVLGFNNNTVKTYTIIRKRNS